MTRVTGTPYAMSTTVLHPIPFSHGQVSFHAVQIGISDERVGRVVNTGITPEGSVEQGNSRGEGSPDTRSCWRAHTGKLSMRCEGSVIVIRKKTSLSVGEDLIHSTYLPCTI